jgi:hypothetical protein
MVVIQRNLVLRNLFDNNDLSVMFSFNPSGVGYKLICCRWFERLAKGESKCCWNGGMGINERLKTNSC